MYYNMAIYGYAKSCREETEAMKHAMYQQDNRHNKNLNEMKEIYMKQAALAEAKYEKKLAEAAEKLTKVQSELDCCMSDLEHSFQLEDAAQNSARYHQKYHEFFKGEHRAALDKLYATQAEVEDLRTDLYDCNRENESLHSRLVAADQDMDRGQAERDRVMLENEDLRKQLSDLKLEMERREDDRFSDGITCARRCYTYAHPQLTLDFNRVKELIEEGNWVHHPLPEEIEEELEENRALTISENAVGQEGGTAGSTSNVIPPGQTDPCFEQALQAGSSQRNAVQVPWKGPANP